MLQPTTPEQREDIYGDVLKLLVPGMLSANVRVGKVDLSLRSMNPGDIFMLQSRMDEVSTVREFRTWVVAGSVWMVNGEIVLGNTSAQRMIVSAVEDLPYSVLRSLFYQCQGLTQRVREAAERVEAYAYEANSRYLWQQIRNNFHRGGGIPNIESIGLNVIQRIWTALNTAEDQRLSSFQAWECAKLVASTQAYKSIKRMTQKEQVHRDHEQQRRQEVMDRAYWKAKGYAVEGPDFRTSTQMLRTKSADELMDEYKRWVAGEQDWHDQVVAEYKGKIKRAMQAEAERIRSLNEEYRRDVAALGLPDSAPGIVGYTPEQVQEILQRAHRPGQMRGARHVPNDDKRFRNFERFIRPKEIPSNLTASDVFRSQSDGPTLDERLANRQVRLDPRERK